MNTPAAHARTSAHDAHTHAQTHTHTHTHTPPQGTLYLVTSFLGSLNTLMVQPVMSAERAVFWRERAAGLYGVLPWAIAQARVRVCVWASSFGTAACAHSAVPGRMRMNMSHDHACACTRARKCGGCLCVCVHVCTTAWNHSRRRVTAAAPPTHTHSTTHTRHTHTHTHARTHTQLIVEVCYNCVQALLYSGIVYFAVGFDASPGARACVCVCLCVCVGVCGLLCRRL